MLADALTVLRLQLDELFRLGSLPLKVLIGRVTEIERFLVGPIPKELDADRETAVGPLTKVGVPLITPLVLSKFKPVGSCPEMEYEVAPAGVVVIW